MLLTFFSYFAIPALTLFLVRGTDWFSTNLSSISISLSRQADFLLWSVVTGCYFFFVLTRLFRKRARVQDIKKETALFFSAAWMMIIFVITPYLPARFPLLSVVHVASALACSLMFFFCMLLLTLKAYWNSPEKYRLCLCGLIAAASFCAAAFILTGIINSAMEICFVVTGSLLAERLYRLSD